MWQWFSKFFENALVSRVNRRTPIRKFRFCRSTQLVEAYRSAEIQNRPIPGEREEGRRGAAPNCTTPGKSSRQHSAGPYTRSFAPSEKLPPISESQLQFPAGAASLAGLFLRQVANNR